MREGIMSEGFGIGGDVGATSRITRLAALLFAGAFLMGAALVGTSGQTLSQEQAPPTQLDELFQYLNDGKYKSFVHRESKLHPSQGPHVRFNRPVRVFLSEDLAASMAAGNASHPAGSSAVKEMYRDDGKTLQGWSVAVKTQEDSDGGEGWWWYEVTSTTDPTRLGGGRAGNGVRVCTGCHASGSDFILTGYPLQ